jgi:hypothetical protein
LANYFIYLDNLNKIKRDVLKYQKLAENQKHKYSLDSWTHKKTNRGENMSEKDLGEIFVPEE